MPQAAAPVIVVFDPHLIDRCRLVYVYPAQLSSMQNTKVFAPSHHRFYDDLITMLMSLSSYMFTLHCTILSNNPKELHERNLQEWISYIKPIKSPNHFMTLEVHSLNQLMVFYPMWIVSPIAANHWPQFIEYQYLPNQQYDSAFMVNSDKNARIISRIIGSSFVSYYEGHKDAFQAKYGSDTLRWPDTLNFARHVRNGFAHGGAFNITNSNVSPVSWRTWYFDYSFHGKSILFSPGSLGAGDIVCLMEELDALL